MAKLDQVLGPDGGGASSLWQELGSRCTGPFKLKPFCDSMVP